MMSLFLYCLFLTIEKILRKYVLCWFFSGTTVAMALLIGEELYVANLGDSEVVLGR
jgi:hypothetical protein